MSLDSPIPLVFEGEEADEKVLVVLRAHPITNIGWVLASIFLLIIPFSVLIYLVFARLENVPFSLGTALVATLFWALIVLGVAFQQFLHWYFNLYILTNKRIVDIDFFGLFHRRLSQTHLINVQDITCSKAGVLQNFLDFGDLNLQTAGTSANFEFLNIPDPEGNQKQMLGLVERVTGQQLKNHGDRINRP
jgi:membrane protein YdbS with pleckstrin-like domain